MARGPDLAAVRLQPGPGGGRVPALRQDPDLPRLRRRDRAVPGHHRAPARAAALRRALVSARRLRLDDDQPRARHFILPYTITGINSAAFHGLFIHYIVGLWITPAGYVLIYYFLPVSARNPLYSHKLSLVGFWSLALFYPVRRHPPLSLQPDRRLGRDPRDHHLDALIIPVWTVLVNFFGTMIGRWQTFGANLPAKFLIMGTIMYLFGCFQGSTEALRSIQQPTHFTDFVISHSHLTVFGTFVVWAIGGLVYIWPRAVRARALVVQDGQLVVLADHRRHLDHGPGPDRRRPAAGLPCGWTASSGSTRSCRCCPTGSCARSPGVDGHRHVAARHQPDDDGARAGRPRRGACRSPRRRSPAPPRPEAAAR